MLGAATLSIALLAQTIAGPVGVGVAPAPIQEPKEAPKDVTEEGAKAAEKLDAEWKEFTPPSKKYTVKMPGEPVEQKQTAKTPAGDIEVVMYIVSRGQTAAFFASTTQLPNPDPNVPVDNVIDGGKNGILAQFPNAKVAEEKKILHAGITGRDLTLDIPAGKIPVPMTINLRLMYADGMLYQFQVVQQTGAAPGISAEEIAGFFGSVKFPKKD